MVHSIKRERQRENGERERERERERDNIFIQISENGSFNKYK